jgi:hypothetical protein|tara:strand:+ start:435 stop:608 length:174 start_codon:yes stop_codon:yes gene_type:complete
MTMLESYEYLISQVHYTKSVSGDMQQIDGDGDTLQVDDDPLVLGDGSNNSDDKKRKD